MTSRHSHPRALSSRGGWRLGAGTACAVAVLLGYGVWFHGQRDANAVQIQQQEQAQVPMVRTQTVQAADTMIRMDLPGSTAAFDLASIYPRASGYVARRLVDIGSRVRKGDLLAVIASPELDRQLSQAQAELQRTRAALAHAKVTAELARITSDRYQALALKRYATQQEADTARLTAQERDADVQSAQAAVDANQANIERLTDLAKYERVLAPFDGVITVRNVDVGDLCNADSGNLIAGGKDLFKEAEDKVLRVRVDVPQSAVIGLADGLTAGVTVPEIPNRVFRGKISRSSESLVSQTRTMRVEVDLDNRDHALRPGLFVTVHLEIPRPAPVVTIPSEALMFDQNGLRVAVVEDGTVHLRTVTLASDRGAVVDVSQGISVGEAIVLTPFAHMIEGQSVQSTEVPR